MECENFTSAVYHKVKNILKEQYIFTNKELSGEREQKSSQKKKNKHQSGTWTGLNSCFLN